MKKIYFIFFCTIVTFFFNQELFAKNSKIKYSRENTSNYFSGVVSAKNNNIYEAYKYLEKTQFLKNSHNSFNTQFIRTLILLNKFEEAFSFSKEVWVKEKYIFEIDLLLGLNYLIKKDYIKSEKHFKRLSKTPEYNYNTVIKNFLGKSLLVWNKVSQNNKKDSVKLLNEIPDRYENFKLIQSSFLQCYFDTNEVLKTYKLLIDKQDKDFSRYNFFLANYLLHKNKNLEAKQIIAEGRKSYSSNLLIKQAQNFILNNNSKKIKNIFNCRSSKDNIAEIFYIIANLYSTEKNFELSNFYLNISFFLNKKFKPNYTLLAENLFNQKKNKESKKIYESIKSIGNIYSWHSSMNIAIISSYTADKEKSAGILEKEFNLITSPDYENYYELANFFKDYGFYEKSVKYYSLALENINKNHFLVPKILDRRGTSYEKLNKWSKAEKDLKNSLQILPNQPYVLNYLAYSWIDKGINIKQSLEMLNKANNLKKNDGYITDSLGWAYYLNKNYISAEIFLRAAVELMPFDPTINDHYADVLWMVNKDIQARYFWKHVFDLNTTNQELKEKIKKKLIFGLNNKL